MIDLMKIREQEIANLFELISSKSKGFTNPKIITIGGYALRDYVPYTRYTRDCDFVLKKSNGWHLDKIEKWLKNKLDIDVFEKKDGYGFLRFVKYLRVDSKKIKIAIDFMEGEVRGRTDKEIVLIDDKFTQNAKKVAMQIGDKTIEMFVPDYQDYLIMKFVSARSSDIRDLAALVWRNGIPDKIKSRVQELLSYPEIFNRKIKDVITPDISDKRFIDSWRGTFLTKEFTEKDKGDVLKRISSLLK